MTKLFDLTGRIAVVTGSAQGMGRAMATALAEAGADLVLLDRNAAGIEATAHSIVGEAGAPSRSVLAVPHASPCFRRNSSEPLPSQMWMFFSCSVLALVSPARAGRKGKEGAAMENAWGRG